METRVFKIYKDPYDNDRDLYLKTKVEFNKGITVLVGYNGAGKTTLMRQLQDQLKKDDIPYFEYNNYSQGGSHAISRYSFYGNWELVARQAFSSEGEQIRNNLSAIVKDIKHFIEIECKDKKELWFFFDAIDSGLDVDEIINIKENFFHFLVDYLQDKDVYIVVSCNSYEMVNGEKALCIPDLKYRLIKSYDKYKSYIIKTKKKYYYSE